MARIVITGGAGFVGSHLSETLQNRGHEVEVWDREDYYGRLLLFGKTNRLTFRKIDLSKTVPGELLSGIDIVFHLAALAHVDYSRFFPELVFENNVSSFKNILNGCKDSHTRLIFSSSVEVYGGKESGAYTEQSPTSPLSPYAASKVACEALLNSFQALYGIHATVFRFTNLYGPAQTPDRIIPRIIAQQLNNITSEVEQGVIRDYMYIQDACDALALMAENPMFNGETFNLSTGVGTDTSQIPEIINSLMPHSQIRRIPTVQHDGRGKSLRISPHKLNDALKWHAQMNLNDGIAKTIEWYKAHPEWIARFHANITSDRSTALFIADTNTMRNSPSNPSYPLNVVG